MDIYENSKDEQVKEQNQNLDEISQPFGAHLEYACFEGLQKKNVDEYYSIPSPTISKQQCIKDKKVEQRNSVFRFFKILQKKINLIRENRKKLTFFQNVYKEKILLDGYSQKQKPSKYQINPKNSLILVFQYVKCVSMVVLLIAITFLWSFSDLNQIRESKIDIVIILILLLDMTSQFNQAIIFRGQIIYDRIIICKQYFSKQFFEDTIFILSFLLIVQTEQLLFVISFYISGILILFKIIRKLEEMFDLSQTYMEILKLAKLLFLINLLAHFIACIWYFTGKNTVDLENNWLDSKGIRHQNQYISYVYSYYWSVVTMVTVGYGDITPQNYVEMIVCVFIMFLSCGVYAYSLNVIGQIVSTLNQQSDKLENMIRTLNKYFKQHNIQDELQNRIKNYLEYKMKEEEQQNEIIYVILNQLSNNLKHKIISDVYQGMWQQCPLLHENFSKNCQIDSSNFIQTQNFEPGDFIIQQNQQNENALYFIDQGSVQLYEQRSKTEICELRNGQTFGEFEFFTNYQAKFSIKCKSRTKVFKLSRQSFIEILNKDDFEAFHFLKHCFEYKIPIKQHQCLACRQNDHGVQNCNILFYFPDLSKLIPIYENIKQFRKAYDRKQEKLNCFQNLKTNQEKQFEYLQQYQQETMNKDTEDEYVIIGAGSQITSLLYNKIKNIDSQENAVNSIRKLNTVIKTKQSLPDSSPQEQTKPQSTRRNKLSLKNSECLGNYSQVDIDRMKEFSNFFGENNYELQIRKYNQHFLNPSLALTAKRKLTRAMRFIQI